MEHHTDNQRYFPPVPGVDFTRYDITTDPNKFWELLEVNDVVHTMRGKVPGGWLISQYFRAPGNKDNSQVGSMLFVADPLHQWKIKREFK